jgi:hypothetical protein
LTLCRTMLATLDILTFTKTRAIHFLLQVHPGKGRRRKLNEIRKIFKRRR